MSATAQSISRVAILFLGLAVSQGLGAQVFEPGGRTPAEQLGSTTPSSLSKPDTSGIRQMATVVAGADYSAGRVRRFLLGDGYRDAWTARIRAPVLHLRDIDGGLVPVELGGGNQSVTLRLMSPSGREYTFRPVDKDPASRFPALDGTFIEAEIQDLTSRLFPGGALLVGKLLDSTGILHVDPELYVMADEPELREFRDTFGGILGTLELYPDEGDDGQLEFAGSSAIESTEEFLVDLDSTPRNQLNKARLLKARLFDFVINDSDRHADQWRWARYEEGDGRYTWEPIPRDRDWAFVDAEGLLIWAARGFYPQLVPFEPTYPNLRGLTIGMLDLDRRLLSELEWSVWEEMIAELQGDLTDDVIDAAIEVLPEPWQNPSGERIADVLKARRDALETFARAYYELIRSNSP